MQVPTGFEILSLVILTVGVVLSIWEGSISGSTIGMSIAVASTFCGAAMLSFSGKVQLQQCQVVQICAINIGCVVKPVCCIPGAQGRYRCHQTDILHGASLCNYSCPILPCKGVAATAGLLVGEHCLAAST